jgi:hypothetical protein
MGPLLAVLATLGAGLVAGIESLFSNETKPSSPSPTTNAITSPTTQDTVYRSYYATKDGRTVTDYYFSFEQQDDGTWLAFIEKQPSYGDRLSDGHSTHRWSNGDRKYVCWDTPIESLEVCQKVAAKWADATQDYIINGKSF